MIGQLQLTSDGQMVDKVEMAIRRLRAFEPEEGYYVAFSGGKDSQCVYHLCKMAGVKFDAHYSVTSVDPPEVIRFIKKNYPDVHFDHPRDKDGKIITMWTLIPQKCFPPTRIARYCCEKLKECGGEGRLIVTGVRWAESARRAAQHDTVNFIGKPKQTIKYADDNGIEYRLNKNGSIVLNDDNDDARRMVEHCYRTRKTIVNPIVDWTDEDVWEFLNSNGIEHCCLYDQGQKRIGCIGCPMANAKAEQLERWPEYRKLYVRAFDRMIEEMKKRGIWESRNWTDGESVMRWWIKEETEQ